MRSLKLFIALFLGSLLLNTGCEPDYDVPPITVPEASVKANTTILELKTEFTGDLDSIGYKTGTTPYIIEGVVIGNDVSGNIYKNIMIQDATAAITISLDGTNLYNSYRLGQRLVINCTGLYLGKYRNLQQLGYPGTSGISFIPLPLFESKAQLNGLPDSPADTLQIKISDLPAAFPELAKYQSQLIELKSVYFVDAGQPFSLQGKSISRTVKDTLGNSIVVYNSGYSNFYTDILPSGLGDIVGILSYFNTGYQVLLRSRADVFNFNGTPVPEPPVDQDNSETNPYTITQAQTRQGETAVWVKGYIVGCVKNGSAVVSDGEFVAPFSSQSNILLAATAGETEIAKLMPVQLVFNTDPRNQLNLKDNPANLGKQVLLKCDLTTYFNVTGIKNITEFKLLP
ncbi:MAG: DUF5689 domain-containing protein [Bacteroidales bacterium]